MIRRLIQSLFILLLIVGCNNSTESNKHGCLDGQATNYDATASIDNNTCTYIDSCGVIDIDTTNDCVQDCAGVWGGDVVIDCAGECEKNVKLWGECYDIETTTILNLSDNQLTGEIPSAIGNLTNLYYLTLYSNQLTGEIPSEIGQLTKLTTLWLNHNQLTGSIPSSIGNLTNLEVLNLSYNQLTGEIPPEIVDLINLEVLSLRGNQLTREIPQISNLTNLTYFGLDSNQLSGLIPEEICNLNLSWVSVPLDHNYGSTIFENQLCPPYPSCIEDFVGEQDTSNCP